MLHAYYNKMPELEESEPRVELEEPLEVRLRRTVHWIEMKGIPSRAEESAAQQKRRSDLMDLMGPLSYMCGQRSSDMRRVGLKPRTKRIKGYIWPRSGERPNG